MVALGSPCLGGAVRDDGIRIDVGGAEPASLVSDVVVNAAALGAQYVAHRIEGLDTTQVPPLHYAKGNYFYLSGRSPFSHLVYPMPSGAWLGVHVGLDLGNRCRFGPDLHWVDTLDYDVDDSRIDSFYASIRRYYPGLARWRAPARLHRRSPQDLRPRRGGSRLRHPGRGDPRHRRSGKPVRDRIPGTHVVARHRRGGRGARLVGRDPRSLFGLTRPMRS